MKSKTCMLIILYDYIIGIWHKTIISYMIMEKCALYRFQVKPQGQCQKYNISYSGLVMKMTWKTSKNREHTKSGKEHTKST